MFDSVIDVYSWPTTNGHKVHILLEESGLPYRVHPVNLETGEQFRAEFLAISPNNKIPAIVDPQGPGGAPMALAESGAILVYLAEKAGVLIPAAPRLRYATLQWLMFQTSELGPKLGSAHHYRYFAPVSVAYAIERTTREAKHLYAVMERQLGRSLYIACDDYTIADIAIYPWLRQWQRQGVQWEDYPLLRAWYDRVGERPAVRRGVEVLAACRQLMRVPASPPVPTAR